MSIPRLDVRDLQVVLAIAATGSTVKAAAKLHVTQSAVSRGLALAEEKLDLRLFDRTRRGLAPEHTHTPVAALRAGEVDIALLTTAAVPAPLLEMPLFTDEIVFVVARKH